MSWHDIKPSTQNVVTQYRINILGRETYWSLNKHCKNCQNSASIVKNSVSTLQIPHGTLKKICSTNSTSTVKLSQALLLFFVPLVGAIPLTTHHSHEMSPRSHVPNNIIRTSHTTRFHTDCDIVMKCVHQRRSEITPFKRVLKLRTRQSSRPDPLCPCASCVLLSRWNTPHQR